MLAVRGGAARETPGYPELPPGGAAEGRALTGLQGPPDRVGTEGLRAEDPLRSRSPPPAWFRAGRSPLRKVAAAREAQARAEAPRATTVSYIDMGGLLVISSGNGRAGEMPHTRCTEPIPTPGKRKGPAACTAAFTPTGLPCTTILAALSAPALAHEPPPPP